MKNETWIISSNDVQKIVRHYGLDQLMDHLISDLHLAISEYNSKTSEIPMRSGFNYEKPILGLVEWMPIHSVNKEVVIKVVGYHPNNPKDFNLPTILSSISSYDTSTGHLKGIVDGVLLTALRTGAASAIASKYMAKSDSSIVGLIGCGAQAVTQLHAISRLFPIEKVMYFDTDTNAMQSFKERCSMLELNVSFIDSSIDHIMASSHIVSTATSIGINEGPLFDDVDVFPSIHINAVGSDFPGKVELPVSILEKSFISPDFRKQAVIEGECQRLGSNSIGPELFEIVQSKGEFDFSKDKISVFDSTGWALEDEVVMNLFLKLAKQFGYGKKMIIENVLEDTKNPYHFLLQEVSSYLG